MKRPNIRIVIKHGEVSFEPDLCDKYSLCKGALYFPFEVAKEVAREVGRSYGGQWTKKFTKKQLSEKGTKASMAAKEKRAKLST